MATQIFRYPPAPKDAQVSAKFPIPESIIKREGKAQVRMLHGQQLTSAQKIRLAEILHERWGSKEGKDFKRYEYEMNCRAQNLNSIIFTAEFQGRIEGAVFPLRAGNPARNWDELTSEGTWENEDPAGSVLICCQIAVCRDARSKGTARSLLVDGVLPLAQDLYKGGRINSMLAFSRPANYGYYSSCMGIEEYLRTTVNRNNSIESLRSQMNAYGRYMEEIGQQASELPISMGGFFRETGRVHIDATMGMHLWFGAKITEIIPNGCPSDIKAGGHLVVMDYTHLLHSGQKPGK